jgi:hypothetical protein
MSTIPFGSTMYLKKVVLSEEPKGRRLYKRYGGIQAEEGNKDVNMTLEMTAYQEELFIDYYK